MRDRDEEGSDKEAKGGWEEEKGHSGTGRDTDTSPAIHSFYVFRQGLVDPGWPQIHYEFEADLELLILLHPPLQF